MAKKGGHEDTKDNSAMWGGVGKSKLHQLYTHLDLCCRPTDA